MDRVFDQATDRLWDKLNRGVSFPPVPPRFSEIDGMAWADQWVVLWLDSVNGRILGRGTLRNEPAPLVEGEREADSSFVGPWWET